MEFSLQLLKEREEGVSVSQDAVYYLQGEINVLFLSKYIYTCITIGLHFSLWFGENILCNGTFCLQANLQLSD